MKVNWKKTTNLSFADLSVGDSFRNLHGFGAVYTKVQLNGTNKCYMLEIATGKLFDGTSSPVELVDVSVQVNTKKPAIY